MEIIYPRIPGLNPLSLTPADTPKPLSLWEGTKGRQNGFGESQPCLALRKTTKRVFSEKLNFRRGAPKFVQPITSLAWALSANQKEAFRATRSPETGFKPSYSFDFERLDRLFFNKIKSF